MHEVTPFLKFAYNLLLQPVLFSWQQLARLSTTENTKLQVLNQLDYSYQLFVLSIFFVIVQLPRPFLDLFWLNRTSNSGQICNTHSRTKNEASLMSVPQWKCIAVAWNGTGQGALRNEPFKMRKIHCVLGRVRHTDRYTDVYEIIACTHVMHTRVCVIINRKTFPFCH